MGASLLLVCLAITTCHAAEYHEDIPAHELGPAQDSSPNTSGAPSKESETPTNWSEPQRESFSETPFRGNWFKKRALLQDMRALHEKIQAEVTSTWIPLHKKFKDTYGPALPQIEAQQHSLGFSEQTITEVEQALSQHTTAPQPPASPHVLPSQRRDIPLAQALLKELRESLHIAQEIHANVQAALRIVDEQEPLGAQLEQQAWKYYEEIDLAYNDHQAAKLYEEVQALDAHMEELKNYLQGQLAPYLNRLVGQFDAISRHIETVYNGLIKQDIVLRTADIPAPKPPAPPPIPELSWWQKLIAWLLAPFYAIARWVKGLFGWK
jgi:hypothetical protein